MKYMLLPSSGRLAKRLARDSPTKMVDFVPNFHMFQESGLISYFIQSLFYLDSRHKLSDCHLSPVTFSQPSILPCQPDSTAPGGLPTTHLETMDFVFILPFSPWGFYSLNTNHKFSSLKNIC